MPSVDPHHIRTSRSGCAFNVRNVSFALDIERIRNRRHESLHHIHDQIRPLCTQGDAGPGLPLDFARLQGLALRIIGGALGRIEAQPYG